VKQWTKIFGTEDFDEPGEGAFYDGHLYVPAYVKGAYGSNTAVGRRDNLLLKIDGETGEEVWAKQWGTGNGDEATSVAIDSAGAIYVAGHWADYDDIRTATLTKFDAEGNQVFEMEDVEIYSSTKVIVDDDDNVFMLLNASSPVIRKIDASNGDVLDETVVKVNGGSWLSLASIVRSKGNDLYTCGERDSDVVIARLDASDLSAQAETWTFGTTNFDSCLDMHGYYLEQSDKWFVRSTGEWGYVVMDDEHGGGTFLSDFFMNTIIFP
jgi:hypothetical protein